MPPPQGGLSIDPSLKILNPGPLTPQQVFYSGLHLIGLGSINGSDICSVTHSWFTEGGESGDMTLP
jgi:hypothetical protein